MIKLNTTIQAPVDVALAIWAFMTCKGWKSVGGTDRNYLSRQSGNIHIAFIDGNSFYACVPCAGNRAFNTFGEFLDWVDPADPSPVFDGCRLEVHKDRIDMRSVGEGRIIRKIPWSDYDSLKSFVAANRP